MSDQPPLADAKVTADDLVVGYRLPTLTRTPTRVTCFLFAVAWWTPHRVHYDIEAAREEGYEDLMVPGLLLNEYVVAAVTGWTGDPSTLRRMTIKNTGPAFAGDTVSVDAVVTGVRRDPQVLGVTFAYDMSKGAGVDVASGTAEVRVAQALQS